ncbi:hypothetical protein, partial [Enterocloster lavalensis]|uniref:hypothetical protein n=1 Tax=Enterocloster lavalensis TaxID=460384 RepID=UPI002FDA7818
PGTARDIINKTARTAAVKRCAIEWSQIFIFDLLSNTAAAVCDKENAPETVSTSGALLRLY